MRELLAQTPRQYLRRSWRSCIRRGRCPPRPCWHRSCKTRRRVVRPHLHGLNSDFARPAPDVALLIEGAARDRAAPPGLLCRISGVRHARRTARRSITCCSTISRAVKAFHGRDDGPRHLRDNVTAFTLSDFGRALKPASNAGTDHGWGNYAFVMGARSRAATSTARCPTQALNGPDDFGKEGRWIPTTRSSNTAPRLRAGSASRKATCPTYSRTSARSRTRTSGSCPDARHDR